MKMLFIFFALFGALTAQTDFSLMFPLSVEYSRSYESPDYPLIRTETVQDTVRINDMLYYRFAPSNSNVMVYLLRAVPDTVFLLEPADSSKAVLYNFHAQPNEPWPVPPSGGPIAINECYWGDSIRLISRGDSVVCNTRTIYNCVTFGHTTPCFDGGLITTVYARDFGKVAFSEVTEGGVLDWTVILPPQDTLTVSGTYTIVGNPCLTVPCIPGVVSAIAVADTALILTVKDLFCWNGFTWDDFSPLPGDSIRVTGLRTRRTDVFGENYFTLEVISAELVMPNRLSGKEERVLHPAPLEQNYPNPFNPSTTIRYHVVRKELIRVTVFDSRGVEIKKLVHQIQAPGEYTIDFAHGGLSSGTYFYRLQVGDETQTKKMILMR
jgi:hypothetical protein